jgi:hypothetical protein
MIETGTDIGAKIGVDSVIDTGTDTVIEFCDVGSCLQRRSVTA